MASTSSGLVEIVRDFLAVEAAVRGLLESYGKGKLRFDEVLELVSDGETSPLFRLKERSHALFRAGPRVAHLSEVLFDLAVGSLFHEAMKLRENLYQREVYGPRVRALREEAGEEAAALFQEFEKIQEGVGARLEEGVAETEVLLIRTGEQLRVLLGENREDGYVSRFLIERRDEAEAVFTEGLDALLGRVHGDPASGYAAAGLSYLESGYFEEAERALAEAMKRGGDGSLLEPARAYARGMASYLKGSYAEAVSELQVWLESASEPDPSLLDLVHTAVSKVGDLAQGDDRDATVRAAEALLEGVGRARGTREPDATSA